MKIAVATEDGKMIAAHFGRSPYFAIFEVQDGDVVSQEMRRNTFTGHFRGGSEGRDHGRHDHQGAGDPHGHRSAWKGLNDCQVVISHGMGRKAWEDLRAREIEMIVTDETDVERALGMYLTGGLEDKIEKLH